MSNILFGVTGSVAAIKASTIVEGLRSKIPDCDIVLIPTKNAQHFLPAESLQDLKVKFHVDKDEWDSWQCRGDPVLHIELRKWADLLIIAPLDANTLGKIANGLADNLLTCVCRAWDFNKPCLIAPAMNTFMWSHPVTKPQIEILQSWGYKEVPCVEKVLMCNDKGLGAMAEPDTIVDFVAEALRK